MQIEKSKLLKKGSVKDIYATNHADILIFEFTDRYSVFDWGEMPDHIPHKAKATADLAVYFFETLDTPSHFIKRIDEKSIAVKKVTVPSDISIYQTKPTNILVPLEVIFRFDLSQSFLKNKRHELPQFETELKAWETKANQKMPLVDFSTKLERIDRYLTYDEAKQIAGLTEAEFSTLKVTTQKLALQLQNIFATAGIYLEDGKFEFAFDENRNFMLVDNVGLDELRMNISGQQLSKEFLRVHYRKSQWFQEFEELKKTKSKWDTSELQHQPAKLPAQLLKQASDLYSMTAQTITQNKTSIKQYLEHYQGGNS